MSDDPFEYVTPPLKIVRDMVAIPRAQHEALMAAARWILSNCGSDSPLVTALRAAGILEGGSPND